MPIAWPMTTSPALTDRLEPVAVLSSTPGGLVIRCRERAGGREVVLKHSHTAQRGDHVLNARFVRESRTLARLAHPGVLAVLDCGEDDGSRYLILEYLDGPTLEQKVESRGPLPVAEAVHLQHQLLDALASVHEAQVLHRDVKPANMLLVPGRGVVLIDFGICRTMLDSQALTESGVMVGTPAFLAPEVIQGGAADPASDLYSAALVLHYMLTGEATFRRPKVFASLQAQVDEAPAALERGPRALRALLASWLDKDPRRRPGTGARGFQSELQRASA